MLVKMMKGKIHRATVTGADLNYEGSIGIDEGLLEAAGLLPGESVHIWNVNTGARLETYTIVAERGSGEIRLNGAAARLVQAARSSTLPLSPPQSRFRLSPATRAPSLQ